MTKNEMVLDVLKTAAEQGNDVANLSTAQIKEMVAVFHDGAEVGDTVVRAARKQFLAEQVADAAQAQADADAEAEDMGVNSDDFDATGASLGDQPYDEAAKDAAETLADAEVEKTPREKTGYASTHGTGTVSNREVRCDVETKSGPCIRPENHPHGHMSAAVRDKKVAAAKAKKDAAKAAAATATADA